LRSKKDNQGVLDFQPATLPLTNEHYARYRQIDQIFKAEPKLLNLVHKDLEEALELHNRQRERRCEYTSDNVLRILICKTIEAETFRGITVRIDDSHRLRWFTRIYDKDMMSHTTLNWLANKISPETWQQVNGALARYAVQNEKIEGDKLRLDTTAIETNIHWPTDSSLLWDVYRVLGRHIEVARELAPMVVADARIQSKRVKKLYTRISREAARKSCSAARLKPLYEALLGHVTRILAWSKAIADRLEERQKTLAAWNLAGSASLIENLRHYSSLGERVADQARRRVILGEQVPNDEKLFSIFEPHTELLKRGKAGKPIEFGHMVLLQQVDGKFITDYRVFGEKPVEHKLVDAAVKSHTKLFGAAPKVFTGDKAFYESMSRLAELEQDIELAAIGKKGGRSEAETARETSPLFKMAQRFRAGIEGTISFLKRCFRLFRCFNKGFEHYAATVGLTVFAHNLLVLARDTG
jgi:IS5 family transposase